MKKSRERGFGLILLVALIAIAGILTTSTTLYFRSTTREVQTKIDLARAYFAAEAGIMEAIYNWHISNADDRLRRHHENATSTPLLGSASYRSKQAQVNFAYVDISSAEWVPGTNQATGAPSRRLRNWQLTNIHDSSSSYSIRPVFMGVEWMHSGATIPQLIDVRLNNVDVLGYPAGTGSMSQNFFTPVPALLPGQTIGGSNTYFEWSNGSGEADLITSVRVVFEFEDRSSTRDSSTNQMSFCGAVGCPSAQRLLTLNAQGEVSSDSNTIVKAVKAIISGAPAGGIEITDWDYANKGYS